MNDDEMNSRKRNVISFTEKINKDKTYKFSLLHAASSDPSVQSLFWSHIHANGIHSPSLFLQANSSDEHVLCSEKEKIFSMSFG